MAPKPLAKQKIEKDRRKKQTELSREFKVIMATAMQTYWESFKQDLPSQEATAYLDRLLQEQPALAHAMWHIASQDRSVRQFFLELVHDAYLAEEDAALADDSDVAAKFERFDKP
jgi:hypothetical protein